MAVSRPKGSKIYHTDFWFKGTRIKRSTGKTSRREAQAFERELREELRKNPPAPVVTTAPGKSLTQASGQYWREHGQGLADCRNVERWLRYIDRYVEDKHIPFRDLSTKHVTALRAAMQAKGIGPISINRTIGALQQLHNYAVRKWEEPITAIVWKGMKTKEYGRTDHISHATAQVLLDKLPLHIREIVLFLLTTGLRRNEAFGLERRRVDLEGNTVSVKVKGGKFRDVLLSPEAALVLKTVPKRDKYVFDTTNYRKHFEAARKAADIEFFRWHDARHTFATWLGQSGAPLEVIRDQLGHSDISVTAKYRHTVEGERRAALARMPAISATVADLAGDPALEKKSA